jgi:formylmethanofuran--tetrahydromethanopterin N-formyltransferase
MGRIGQCTMTCPTTAAFNGLLGKRVFSSAAVSAISATASKRKPWLADANAGRIPVMEGNFIVEDGFGAMEAVAGGNFMIFAKTAEQALAAEAAVDAIRAQVPDVIMPFPGGVCRSGSKAGSMKYKLKASTNQTYCPTLRAIVPDTVVPEGAESVLEIVINGLTLDAVKKAMAVGVASINQLSRRHEDFRWQLWWQTGSIQSVPKRSHRCTRTTTGSGRESA